MNILMKLSSMALLLFVFDASFTESIKIGSFNVKSFGKSKMKDPAVIKHLVNIIKRYDILVMQEIRDKSGESLKALLNLLNGPEGNSTFSLITSERLGGKYYKEQFAFIYKSDIDIILLDTFQYPDPYKSFKRAPFCVLFQFPKLNHGPIALVAIHTAPNNTVRELEAIEDVHTAVRQRWQTENILLVGDLNAGCNYLRRKDLKKLNLRNSKKYNWLINDDVDTTVRASTHCAFDRFILTGQELHKLYVQGSAQAFNFDSVYGLSESVALKVSDHYPIEVEFKEARIRNEERKRNQLR